MAMNDISMLAVSEQDSYLVKKDSDKAKLDSSNDAGFFDQLALANQASETQDSEVKAPNKQPSDEQPDLKEQTSEEKLLSGEDMLAQINAAQVIDTSVKNNSHSGAELIDKDGVKINIKPEDKLAPIVINLPSDEIVDDPAIIQAQNVVGAASASKTAAESSQLGTKSIATAATAGESETVKNEQAVAKPSDKPTVPTSTKASIDASVLALLSKDDNAIKADKLLANLTPSQQDELATELDAMSKPINKDNVADLKQLLSKYVSESEKPQTPQQAINTQISTLTTPEKQALLNQMQAYIKSEPLSTKELTLLKGVISDLETAINADTLSSAKDKPLFANNTLIAGVTPKTQQGTESANVKPELKSESSKSIAETPEELAKQLDVLQKESMRATNAEQMPPRAAQIFSQIINIFDKSSLNTIAKYDTLGYEQAIIEAQSLQAGQLQSTAQAKQVSIDPATLQALNIIKSDAAKMLQERVTSMLSINNKEAEIRLDPPEMGSMQIRIRSDAEQAQINFVVQNQQAKEALEQSLPRLRELLMQQGLELGESSISYGGSSPEQNEQQEGQPQGQMANNSSSDETNSEQPDKQTHSSGQQTSSSIDYYA
ncbi:flagellar hook-length control protein FliK [Pseudoalteromonas sp. meg-B1]|uniref:flagellar hook-length control protein FliK n=1 Tax=Pseudoalteromonas sp. meg-B1 TaxID=2203192 RepID=UPI000D6F2163|nr:flagellar hook-length control protein FliK [Pseudoalteromonas sp. meg-B1]PWS55675.1 flagellar hook-length control protein FliK [Pseudoalteromonas sp. meg-B1]